ncbi:MAG: excinuclease ABC subunit UvrC [Thermoanaerobacteraceae bacterium]
MNIKEKLKLLPEKPGIYIMKDKDGNIIYVGKAVILKNRVKQYFQNQANQIPKVKAMVSYVEDIEYIVTDTELEALMLECNLIKKYKPKYNVLLKDDKSYPYIKVTVKEDYPRIIFTRRVENDGGKYFGPYSSSFAVKETIKMLRKMFPLRSCNRNLDKDKNKQRECLYYHIGLCSAPCINNISKDEYKKLVDQALMFLEGKHEGLIKELKSQMENESLNLRFEEAAKIRDQIFAIEKTSEKQKVISPTEDEQDVISMVSDDVIALVQVFFIRDGKLSGREHYYMKNIEGLSRGEIISSFIKQYYEGAPNIPKEIIIDTQIDDQTILRDWLTKLRGNKVFITVPVRGKKKDLVEMVFQNAIEVQKNDLLKINISKKDESVSELCKLLGLEYKERIEAYDISNTKGQDNVASMVVFENGIPKKSQYRKFIIKSIDGQDDYGSMREVLRRRISHGIEEQKLIENGKLDLGKAKFYIMPDLILLDGGLGHVNAIKEVLEEYNYNIPVYGMVKNDKHKTKGLIGPFGEVELSIRSKAFRLIANIQEEVHRFAITFHRNKQSKRLKSELLNIPGIGEKRAKYLYETFKTIEEIKKANIEELKKVKGMDEKTAKNLFEYYRNN